MAWCVAPGILLCQHSQDKGPALRPMALEPPLCPSSCKPIPSTARVCFALCVCEADFEEEIACSGRHRVQMRLNQG